jgi:DNA invertase Pin-like site-specific DNA recombinase
MRESASGPTLAEQEALLRQAGIVDFAKHAPVYIDKPRRGPVRGTPERDKLLRALRPGDVVVIARATRLGTSRADVLGALAAITKAGCVVLDVQAEEEVSFPPEAFQCLVFLERAERDARRESTARMRAHKVAMGALGGRPERLQGPRKKAAADAWADLTKTVAQVAEEFNVAPRTLYRLFGAKGTPRFGKKAQP